MELSRGELEESAGVYGAEGDMSSYLDRIYNKTASLFTTAAESGAILSGAGEDIVTRLRDYGYNVGMAYQIVDDILDFEGDPEEFGKPVGQDLAHGILTLPALIALERGNGASPILDYLDDPEDERTLAAGRGRGQRTLGHRGVLRAGPRLRRPRGRTAGRSRPQRAPRVAGDAGRLRPRAPELGDALRAG